jgi:hypothetical protein
VHFSRCIGALCSEADGCDSMAGVDDGAYLRGMRTMDLKLISLLAEVTRTRKEKQDWS